MKAKFVYKNEACMKKMHDFYDRTLAALGIQYSEDYFDTSFGKTHCLIVGDASKPRLCTIHGGNGITTLNLKLFLPLLSEYSIIAPDVIAMPGKSEPYRNISSKKDEFGFWIKEVLDFYKVGKISFVVSSYSASMFLSFAKHFPKMVDRSLLLVPSGIAHGPVLPMIKKMIVPFTKYYFSPSKKTLDSIIQTMAGESDATWKEFFDLMMSSYKMELRSPKEYNEKDLASFNAPLLIIASQNDIFFPADRVFKRAKEIFKGPVTTVEIDSKHLPSPDKMVDVCERTLKFLKDLSNAKITNL